MTRGQALGMQANIRHLKARRLLDEVELGKVKLTPDSLWDTIMDATGDRRYADRAHYQLTEELLKQGSTT